MYHQPLPYHFKIRNCNEMQVVFSEEFSFPFFLFSSGEMRGGLGRQGRNNQKQGENHFFQNIFISCILCNSAWAKTIWIFNHYFQSECLSLYCEITLSLIKYIYMKAAIPRTHYFFSYLMLLIGVRPEQINSSFSINCVPEAYHMRRCEQRQHFLPYELTCLLCL